ncbi:uncharacterized protein IUM83_05756 [Phytophthora cinnamomi]|uniref:uncharacterized protein n=1 Tax=Phytophthora cinnamomi TaxID=4785 RepID=UPI00355AADB4|nr:hypothetical protein IUM83_05756 [Phytophthora cinnamomi]
MGHADGLSSLRQRPVAAAVTMNDLLNPPWCREGEAPGAQQRLRLEDVWIPLATGGRDSSKIGEGARREGDDSRPGRPLHLEDIWTSTPNEGEVVMAVEVVERASGASYQNLPVGEGGGVAVHVGEQEEAEGEMEVEFDPVDAAQGLEDGCEPSFRRGFVRVDSEKFVEEQGRTPWVLSMISPSAYLKSSYV